MTSKIEQQVMASVGVIYTARQFFSVSAFKLYAVAASVVALWQLTWVTRVFNNLAEAGLEGALNFVAVAFVNAEFAVQLTLVVLAVAGFSLLRDLVRPTHSYRLA